MLITLADVLHPVPLQRVRHGLRQARWIDGRTTAGAQSAAVKNNLQMDPRSSTAADLGDVVLRALRDSPAFLSAAMPRRIYPPLFNRYGEGHAFGAHVDNAIRPTPDGRQIRTDLSCTLFLSDPGTYDGGELVIEDPWTEQHVKLPAGSLVLYPATSVHRVTEISRGERTAAFFWIESMVRDHGKRRELHDLDRSIQALATDRGVDDPLCVSFSAVYHNLVRRWADP